MSQSQSHQGPGGRGAGRAGAAGRGGFFNPNVVSITSITDLCHWEEGDWCSWEWKHTPLGTERKAAWHKGRPLGMESMDER